MDILHHIISTKKSDADKYLIFVLPYNTFYISDYKTGQLPMK